jgi:hypothetical protein
MTCTFAIEQTAQMQTLEIELKLKLAHLEADFERAKLALDVQKLKGMSELMDKMKEHRTECAECKANDQPAVDKPDAPQ